MRFYPDDYGKTLQRSGILENLQKIKFNLDIRRAGLSKKRAYKFFDLGAGQGDFISHLRKKSYEAEGMEMSSAERNRAHNRFGISLRSGVAENFDFLDSRYDFVFLRHVLEHTFDPILTLQNVRQKGLTRHGKVVILVPNIDSFEAKLFRKYWHGFDVPRHRFHFSKKSLSRILVDTGYSGVKFYVDFVPIDILRSFRNFLNFKVGMKNFIILREILALSLTVLFVPLLLPIGMIKPSRYFVVAEN
jgi:predicted SAM-dependent methyltransferase